MRKTKNNIKKISIAGCTALLLFLVNAPAKTFAEDQQAVDYTSQVVKTVISVTGDHVGAVFKSTIDEKVKEKEAEEARIEAEKKAEEERLAEEARLKAEEEARIAEASKTPDQKSYASANGYQVLPDGTEIDFQSRGAINMYGYHYTYYSSNVLWHYRTNEWYACDDHIYRTGEGYVVVASNDFPQGTIVDTPFGKGQVLDSGCASGTIDIYVNF